MARQTRQITDQSEDDTPILEAGFEDVSGLVDAQEAMADAINAEIGTPDGDVRWKIRVYRVDPRGKDMAYLFELIGESIEGLSNRLRDEYGTGKYVARVYKNSKLYKAPVFNVEAAKNAPPPAMDHGGSALVHAVTQQGAILNTVVQQLVALKQAPPAAASPVDPVGMMKAMAEMLGSLQSAIPKPPPPPPAPDPMAIMSTAIEMAKSLQDGGRDKSMIEVVAEFMQSDLMKTVVQNAQQQQNAQPPQIQQPRPRPQIQPPSPGAAPPVAPAPAAPPQNEDEAKFAALLTMLIARAAADGDPVLWADVIEETVDRPTLEALLKLPDPVGAMAAYNPAVATYRVWFASLIEALTDTGDGVDREGALDQTADTPLASGVAPAPVGPAVTT
jgi:hypothetical protein